MRRLAFLLALLAALAVRPAASSAGPEGPDAPLGYLGFHAEPLSILSAEQRAELGVDVDAGTAVSLILPGGPAAQAGLHRGDLLLRLNGMDLPQIDTHDRYLPVHHAWRVAMRALMASIRVGSDVEAVVLRGGKRLTLTLHPVDGAMMHHMQGGSDVPIPPPPADAAGVHLLESFDGACPAGTALPAGFWIFEGHWHVVDVEGAASGKGVLRQDLPVLPWAPLIVTGKGRAYRDAHLRVRFKPVSGITDASGGVIWRAQDGQNYYLARANALEDNFEIYTMKDGVRTTISAIVVDPPSLGAWHVIDVWFQGPHFRATLDGKDTVEATDETWSSGWCGLWTKADSVTLFDDFEVTPEAGD